MTTASDVARWMANQLEAKAYIYQDEIVYSIQKDFGDEFVYLNQNGNYGIVKPVLDAFNKLTPEAIWSRGERCWRKRAEYDRPGRMQS